MSLRRLPYPYSAMLAICSDLDETPNRDVYWQIARFLNTSDMTSMGAGVGLEVGNTIYFDMPADQFSYWNTDDAGREMVHRMIRSGHIDCLHSFGDFADTREHAGRALDALSRNGCRLEVWIDHSVAPTNFGADIMQGSGDLPGAKAYHADLTCGFGVKYVWRGRVTSVTGQNTERRFGGIWTRTHAVQSGKTLLKEVVKAALSRMGSEKYEMHRGNDILRPVVLRDGRQVQEFFRSNPCWGGVSYGDTGLGIPQVLTASMLDRLVERRGTCILYTHLGKIKDLQRPFPPETREAFRLLAERYRRGQILVATTKRVLDYWSTVEKLRVSASQQNGTLEIVVSMPMECSGDPSTSILAGLTFYTGDASHVRLLVNGRRVEVLQNPADETGQASVSIPWSRLEFPL